VIIQNHALDTHSQDFFGDFGSNPQTTGGILAINNRYVNRKFFANSWDPVAQYSAA
jgi:hypothetical protein